ncbi:hypothetical protein A1D17_02500 [Pseudomonas fluorescens]|uniref:Uncharacterized protein n=2 Tax=Pseudomonas TaxID=286 RepID=A0A166QKJ7_PSEFL|nr:hypothetical protein A1D17_02500 [Pseudomonas fluorescens]
MTQGKRMNNWRTNSEEGHSSQTRNQAPLTPGAHMNNLDSYITQLLSKPDPELDARRSAFNATSKDLEREIAAVNTRVKAAGTLAEKIDLRSREEALRESLRQHKLNFHEYMQATPEVKALPTLNG